MFTTERNLVGVSKAIKQRSTCIRIGLHGVPVYSCSGSNKALLLPGARPFQHDVTSAHL